MRQLVWRVAGGAAASAWAAYIVAVVVREAWRRLWGRA